MAKTHQPSLEKVRKLAKVRRDLYGLLSSAYLQIPERTLFEINWDPASEILGYPLEGTEKIFQEIQKGLNLVKPYGSKRELTDAQILTSLSRDWTRLFRGVVKDGILPPYESHYRPQRQQKKSAQQINRLFSKMGILVPEEWHQPSDYIGVELDFMRFLCEKEWRLRSEEKREVLGETVEAEKSFLEDHLALWIPIFCKRMAEEAKEKYYLGIAHLTVGLVGFDGLWVPQLLA
jgi:TorA maturation chaperone TorD